VLANPLSKCVVLLTISRDQVLQDMEKQATKIVVPLRAMMML
jgi:hypothetical protein